MFANAVEERPLQGRVANPAAEDAALKGPLFHVYRGIYQMARTAKLFRNGRSQALRLPAEYRFEGSEVYIRKDAKTGDIVLSRRQESWQDCFDLADQVGLPDEFLGERNDAPPQKRKLF